MTFIVISMVLIVAVAAGVVAFVALPHRGQDEPGVPFLGEAMDRASGEVPTRDPQDAERPRGLASLHRD